MNCAKCGKEFGEGVVCQHCGVDRVTGLANYKGYTPSTGSNTDLSDKSQQYGSSTNGGSNSFNTMICYACEEIIPDNSEYCPHCGKELYVTCPKCGNIFSSQLKFCNQCGLERKEIIYWKCSFCGYLDLDNTIDKCPKCGKSSWELVEF